MFGLSPEIDLAFLVGRSVREVHADAYQVRIVFDEGLEIAIECECEVDGAVLSLEDLGPALSSFVGRSVQKAEHRGSGSVLLTFDLGRSLALLDANEQYESYNITWKGGSIVV